MEAPSTGDSLAPTAACVWYPCDETVSFGGAGDVPQTTFAATSDTKPEAVFQLLIQRGFEPIVWDRQVAPPRAKIKQRLNWIGDLSLRSDFKWCTNKSSYRDERNRIDSSLSPGCPGVQNPTVSNITRRPSGCFRTKPGGITSAHKPNTSSSRTSSQSVFDRSHFRASVRPILESNSPCAE